MRTLRATRPTRPVRKTRPLRGESVSADPLTQNRARLAVLGRLPPPRLPAPQHPDRIVRKYAARLERIAADCYAIVARTVIAELWRLQRLADEPDARADAEDDPPDPEGIVKIGKRAGTFEQEKREARAQNRPHTPEEKLQLTLPFSLAESLIVARRSLDLYAAGIPDGVAPEVAREIEQWRHKVDVRVFESLGLRVIDPGSKLDVARHVWTKDNSDLIVSQPRELADRIGGMVDRMVRDGSRWETLAKHLEEQEGLGRSRARLIARDQVQKYAADVNRLQQQAAGITHYVWMGAMDNRERPTHVAMEGQVVAWDQPPVIGHPGSPIQCRCVPVPSVSDRQIATSRHMTADELSDRTAALGPMQREAADITPADVAKRAASQVKSDIKQAARRADVART